MNIYQLMLFICVTTNDNSLFIGPSGMVGFGAGDGSYTKSCSWKPNSYFIKENSCENEGLPQIGKPVHSFVVTPNSSTVIENFKCAQTYIKE